MSSDRARTAAVIAAVLVAAFGLSVYLRYGQQDLNRADQRFVAITDQNPFLATIQLPAREQLGHGYCAALARHHGDTAATDSELAATDRELTPAVLHTLAIASTVAYCPGTP